MALCEAGVDAIHVRDRSMNGATDEEVFAKAMDEDRIVVTINVQDFEDLAALTELHPGLMLIEESGLSAREQFNLVNSVIVGHREHEIERERPSARNCPAG